MRLTHGVRGREDEERDIPQPYVTGDDRDLCDS